MVTYQTYIRIGFNVAESKGASFEGIDDGGDFISQLAELWNSETGELEQMTETQVRRYLQDRVSQ